MRCVCPKFRPQPQNEREKKEKNADICVHTQGDEVEKWRKMFRAIFPSAEDVPDPVVYENAYFTAAIDPTLGGSALIQQGGGQRIAPQHHPNL